ncbi:hypothetical protein ACPJHQ_12355 [Rossellomorea sp. H39__3]
MRQVYPNVLHLERKLERTDEKKKQSVRLQQHKQTSGVELFKDFYNEMTSSDFTDEKEALIQRALEKATKEVEAR